jgi:ribosome-binding factor A
MKINYQKETKSNPQLQKASALQRILADIFSKSSFSIDNKQIFVNVTYVDLSRNFANAKVVVDTFGLSDEKKKELVKELNTNFARQIRSLVAQKFKTRYTPEIIFSCTEENKKTKKVLTLMEEERNKMGKNGE